MVTTAQKRCVESLASKVYFRVKDGKKLQNELLPHQHSKSLDALNILNQFDALHRHFRPSRAIRGSRGCMSNSFRHFLSIAWI